MSAALARAAVLAFLAQTSARRLEAPAAEADTEHGHLESVVTAWLRAAPTAVEPPGSLTPFRPWPVGYDPEPVLSRLPAPVPVSYHPWRGCMGGSVICYPCKAFLEDLVKAGPGPLVVDIGSFLGESTVGLRLALKAAGHESAQVLAVDTWHEHVGYTGLFQHPTTWTPPAGVGAGSEPPPLFHAFMKNVGGIGGIQPLPLLAAEATAWAAALGANTSRPALVYINPPRRHGVFHQDLHHAWRLLSPCGTLAGSGYHLPFVRAPLDALAQREGAVLEARAVHAPGALKVCVARARTAATALAPPPTGCAAATRAEVAASAWQFENIHVPFSEAALMSNRRSNFSTWVLRPKGCDVASSPA